MRTCLGLNFAIIGIFRNSFTSFKRSGLTRRIKFLTMLEFLFFMYFEFSPQWKLVLHGSGLGVVGA